MNKSKLIVPALITLVTLTGCGGKKLSCTMEQSSLGLENKTTIQFNFKEDKINSMKATIEMVLPDEYKDQKQDLIDELKDSDENITVTETKNGIKATITGDSDQLEELGLDDETVNYEDVKKELEDQGYTCK